MVLLLVLIVVILAAKWLYIVYKEHPAKRIMQVDKWGVDVLIYPLITYEIRNKNGTYLGVIYISLKNKVQFFKDVNIPYDIEIEDTKDGLILYANIDEQRTHITGFTIYGNYTPKVVYEN